MRTGLIGLVGVALAVAAVTASGAATLCVKKSSGIVVARDTGCKKKETPLNLAQSGAVGPTGPQGVSGAQGVIGPTGAQGADGTAVAFARVRQGATLDATRSKNVVDVLRETGFATGIYCLYGNFTTKNAVASVDWTDSTGAEYVQTISLDNLGNCPASSTGAPAKAFVLIRRATDASLQDAGFYITFN